MADRTNMPALSPGGLSLAGPLHDVDVVEPEPLVAVMATPSLLRRRIVAALDFDRLPIVATTDTATVVEGDGPSPTVAVLAGDEPNALLPRMHETRRSLPDAHVVLVFGRALGGPLRRALRAGAAGAVEASQVETGLALAVRAAAAGLLVVPEAMRERLEPPALSPREREVLALAAEGATTGEIATRLTVSSGTVKRHLSSCFSKLGVENRGEALALLFDANHDPGAADLG